MKPIVVINLKTYQQGKEVIKLVRKIEKVDKKIILGVQATDIFEIKKVVKNPVFAEHVDFQEKGRNTGFILPEAVKVDGAKGVFLNHSEHKLKFRILKKTSKRCREVGLKTLIFADSLREAKKIKKLKPDYLVIEPPELVAGKKSISKAKPGLINQVSDKLKYNFLVGAGIHNNEDVEIAMELGASGIAISSSITKAKNPEKNLKELLGK